MQGISANFLIAHMDKEKGQTNPRRFRYGKGAQNVAIKRKPTTKNREEPNHMLDMTRKARPRYFLMVQSAIRDGRNLAGYSKLAVFKP